MMAPRDVVILCSSHLTFRSLSRDLPDASNPTADAGFARSEWSQSYRPAAEKRWTIRASRRPTDPAPRLCPWKYDRSRLKTKQPIAENLKDDAAADDQVPHSPAAVELIRINPARHPENARDVHEIEREMETDQEKPKVPLAQRLVHHAAGHLGKPIVEGGEDGEENRAHQDIVEVRDHEIRSAELPVERRGRQHDAGKTRDQKLKQERDTKQHCDGEADVAAPKRRDPVEDLDSGGNGDDHRGEREKCIRSRRPGRP